MAKGKRIGLKGGEEMDVSSPIPTKKTSPRYLKKKLRMSMDFAWDAGRGMESYAKKLQKSGGRKSEPNTVALIERLNS